MMDKKKLLDNGLLEQYILGELNETETQQIEDLLQSDGEVKTYFDALEASFERLGQDNAIIPPVSLKQELLKQIRNDRDAQKEKLNPPLKSYVAVAASLIALLILGSFWMYNKLNTLQDQLQVAERNNAVLNLQIDALQGDLEETTKFYAAITDPDTKQYILEGNDLMPEGKAVSYVNHNSRSVIVNTQRLPQLDAEHDYQMWADVNGEMVNMGVIKKGKTLLAMNYIADAESLNITVEPSGGSEHPTVEHLVTNVYLN
jgi:anti-sigma-K factor RskA